MISRVAAGIVLATALHAQNSVRVIADCVIGFTFTASGSTPVIAGNPNTGDNRQAGCVSWTLQYQSTGFSGVTLTIQDAPGPLTPGSWVTYAGTIDVGINPNTSTTGASTIAHNGAVSIPWIRVTAALTGAGTLNGVLYGLKAGSLAGGSPPSSGTVTSVGTACGLKGGPITTTGTISLSELVNAQTGTAYTILASDCGKLLTFTNSMPIAVTVPAAGGSFPDGFPVSVENYGSGTATLTPAAGTIGGASTLVLPAGSGCALTSDGTNWDIQCGTGGISIGSLISGGTAGSVLFVNPTATVAQDNGNFHWNDSTKCFSIGTATCTSSGGSTDSITVQGVSGNNASMTLIAPGANSSSMNFWTNGAGRFSYGAQSNGDIFSYDATNARDFLREQASVAGLVTLQPAGGTVALGTGSPGAYMLDLTSAGPSGAMRVQTGTVDFSATTHTAPTIVVASTGALPSSGCVNGELAIVTGATLGQQIYENSGVGTCVWTQQLNSGGGSSGGGVITYSGPSLSTVTGTIFCPAGGGGTCSGTEANVDLASSSAATVTNLSVQLSAALGMGNSVTVTWRKAGADQSSTCTISGASATECQDTTHSFNVSQGDLIDYKLVFSGTVLVNPFLSVMSQFGTTGVGVTSVSSANGSITVASPTTTPVLTCATATSSLLGCSSPDNSTMTATAGVYKVASTTIGGATCTPGGSCTPNMAPAGSYSEYNYRASGTAFGAATNTGPVPTAGWTLRNSAVLTNFAGDSSAVFVAPNTSPNFRFATQPLSAPPYTVIARLQCNFQNYNSTSSAAQACGVYLYDGTKIESFEELLNNTPPELNVRQSSAVTSGGSSVGGPTANLTTPSDVVLKIVDDGTNRTFYYYTNGAFTQFFQEATAAFLTPTAVGFGGIDTSNGTLLVYTSMNLKYWCVAAATTCNGL